MLPSTSIRIRSRYSENHFLLQQVPYLYGFVHPIHPSPGHFYRNNLRSYAYLAINISPLNLVWASKLANLYSYSVHVDQNSFLSMRQNSRQLLRTFISVSFRSVPRAPSDNAFVITVILSLITKFLIIVGSTSWLVTQVSTLHCRHSIRAREIRDGSDMANDIGVQYVFRSYNNTLPGSACFSNGSRTFVTAYYAYKPAVGGKKIRSYIVRGVYAAGSIRQDKIIPVTGTFAIFHFIARGTLYTNIMVSRRQRRENNMLKSVNNLVLSKCCKRPTT